MSDGRGWPKGRKRTAADRAKCRERMLARWQDPEYRAKYGPMFRANMIRAQAILVARKAAVFPKRGTPEGKYYRKVRDSLGVKAAREALGIGQ